MNKVKLPTFLVISSPNNINTIVIGYKINPTKDKTFVYYSFTNLYVRRVLVQTGILKYVLFITLNYNKSM